MSHTPNTKKKIKNSVCAGCYALKGNYTRYPAIKAAQYYRLASLMEPSWIPAMVTQIKRQKFFRWHDAGDIQSAKHLTNIFEVCKLTPSTKPRKIQAASFKPQAASFKRQAASDKLKNLRALIKFHATRSEVLH